MIILFFMFTQLDVGYVYDEPGQYFLSIYLLTNIFGHLVM